MLKVRNVKGKSNGMQKTESKGKWCRQMQIKYAIKMQ